MAYQPTKTHYGIALLIIVALVVWYGWKNWGWFASPKTAPKKDGDACVDTNGNPSIIVNGVCKEVVRPNPNGGGNGGNSNMAQ